MDQRSHYLDLDRLTAFYDGALWTIDQFIESTEDNPRKGIASDYWVLRFVEARNHLIQEAKENGITLEEDPTPAPASDAGGNSTTKRK
jgi:hypothetical protein